MEMDYIAAATEAKQRRIGEALICWACLATTPASILMPDERPICHTAEAIRAAALNVPANVTTVMADEVLPCKQALASPSQGLLLSLALVATFEPPHRKTLSLLPPPQVVSLLSQLPSGQAQPQQAKHWINRLPLLARQMRSVGSRPAKCPWQQAVGPKKRNPKRKTPWLHCLATGVCCNQWPTMRYSFRLLWAG